MCPHSDSVAVVAALIERGADVNARDRNGRTALWHAAQFSSLQVLRELHRCYASVDAKDSDGRTALSHAASAGKHEAVLELIRVGASVHAVDHSDRSALSHAAELGQLEVLTALARRGAGLDVADTLGRTALSYAAQSGRVAEIACLVQLGAATDAKDTGGRTPASYAAESSRVQAFAELVRHGANALSRLSDSACVDVMHELLHQPQAFRSTTSRTRRETDDDVLKTYSAEAVAAYRSLCRHCYCPVLTRLLTADDAALSDQEQAAHQCSNEHDSVKAIADFVQRSAVADAARHGARTALSRLALFGSVDAIQRLRCSRSVLANAASIDCRTLLAYVARDDSIEALDHLLRLWRSRE